MTTPKSSSFRGWWNDRHSGTLDLYYGSGAAGAPAEVQRVDANGTTIVTGDLALADGTVYLYNGGTVTQATNKSTGGELNTDSGQITMNGAALGDDTEISFVVTNSNVAATDVVIVNHPQLLDIFFILTPIASLCFAASLTLFLARVVKASGAALVATCPTPEKNPIPAIPPAISVITKSACFAKGESIPCAICGPNTAVSGYKSASPFTKPSSRI